MKELLEIVAAFESLVAAGKPAALATVIAVEGSAYRRPGARMLIAEDGRTWGGVSGGCLERDVARRAVGVIDSGRPLRCRYNTGDDEAITAGAATGCGGLIELFIQPVSAEFAGPIGLFRRLLQARVPLRICTVVRAAVAEKSLPAASCVALDDITEDPSSTCSGDQPSIPPWVTLQTDGCPRLVGDPEWGEYFVENLLPPQSLVVFGAGPDVVPLVTIAKALGWHVTVVGSRPSTGITERFSNVDDIHVTASDDPVSGIAVPPDAAVLVMTHNVARDQAIVSTLRGPLRYLGILGPRHRARRLLAALPDGKVPGVSPDRLFAPVGLDLGADTPQEIALSIIAEIQSALRRTSPVSLSKRPGPIHCDAPESDGSARKSRPRQQIRTLDGEPACRA